MKRLITFVVLFVLMSQLTLGQRDASAKARLDLAQTYNGVGLIRKVIAENEDFTASTETFMFEDQTGRMFPVQGKFDFDLFLNKKVQIRGRLGSAVKVSSLVPLERIDERRIPQPQNFPLGVTEYDLSTKDGHQRLSAAAENNAIILPQPTVGDRQTVVVPVTFTNNTNLLLSQAELSSRIYTGANSVRGFFQEASNNRFRIYGQVLPSITIPFTDADCANNMFSTWTQAAMAQIPMEILEGTNNYVFLPPAISTCSMTAVSTAGNKGVDSVDQIAWIQQTPFVVGDLSLFTNAIAHELGHQLGLQHAEGVSLSGAVCASCDRADFMGARLRYPNAYHRLTMGWLVGTIAVVNGPGEYPFTLRSPGVVFGKLATRAVLITRYDTNGTPIGDMKILENRADLNFYELFGIQFAAYRLGVSIRRGSMDLSLASSRSYLYHMNVANPIDYDNAPLAVGNQFVDPSDGSTIEAQTFSIAGGARIKVTTTRGP